MGARQPEGYESEASLLYIKTMSFVIAFAFVFKAQAQFPGFQRQKAHRNGKNSVH